MTEWGPFPPIYTQKHTRICGRCPLVTLSDAVAHIELYLAGSVPPTRAVRVFVCLCAEVFVSSRSHLSFFMPQCP